MNKKLFYQLIGILFLILLWFWAARSAPLLIPSPIKIAVFLISDFYCLCSPLLATMESWVAGFLSGAAIGILSGAIIGCSDNLYNALEFPIDFLRSLPAIVILPITAIFLGIGKFSQIFIISFTAALYMLINTTYGIKYAQSQKILLAKIFNMTIFQKFKNIIIPSALPIIFAGLRIALSLSLVVAIASEMIIGGTRGLGKKIMDDMVVYNLTEMYAIIILIGSLGFISNKLFSVLENKIIHWKGHN